MKAMVSAVDREAEPIRSASFSRPGSSATMTSRPFAISAMISSTGLKVKAGTVCTGFLMILDEGCSQEVSTSDPRKEKSQKELIIACCSDQVLPLMPSIRSGENLYLSSASAKGISLENKY